MPSKKEALTYRAAGVDIDAGEEVVERIKPLVARTFRKEVMAGLGGFGALFELAGRYREPVLVSGTDGVGTKLKLAQMLSRHDTIGIDLVGMCVNDVLVQGAEPLFFLDYFATGKLNVDTTVSVVSGIARGCELAGCALIGGETAEMPDMYPPGEYDLAGFCVGAVEKSSLIDGGKIKSGDAIVGIASSGPHSNGYSLIRKILARADNPFDLDIGGVRLADALLAPTTIYVKPILQLLAQLYANPCKSRHPCATAWLTSPAAALPKTSSAWCPRVSVLRSIPRRGNFRRVRLAAARRQCSAKRDVAHVQLRHRLHRDRGTRCRSGNDPRTRAIGPQCMDDRRSRCDERNRPRTHWLNGPPDA